MEASSKMSSFFKPKDYKEFEKAPARTPLPDGSYEPVLTDEDLKVCSRRMCLMDTASYSYATQNAPCAMFAAYWALRKIYAGDEAGFNAAILNQLDCVFNATPPVSGLLLGAGLAIEDKGHAAGMEAENDLKVGLMGPLSGIGSIAGYMAQNGSPVGILLWLAIWLVIYIWRMQNYCQGYKAGASVVTKLGDKLTTLTDAASILGLMVVGSLIFSSVKITTPLTFAYGDISLAIQTGVLDAIFPNLLGLLTAVVVYRLIKKGVKLNWIILGIVVISCVCAAFGILAA